MKLIDLSKGTFSELFDIVDSRLEMIKGYDLDDFAIECSRGNVSGVENEDTLASVDAIYIEECEKIYKIEAKDVAKTIYYRILGYTKISMKKSYLEKKNKENYKAIDMEKKIFGTERLLSRLEDIKEYLNKGYLLMINEDVTILLNKCEPIEREELENQLLLFADEIIELKEGISDLLKEQDGFKVCNIEGLIDILNL
ncbi:MAG: hypothetical protein ACRC28_11240 [Clostridium sp.]|uniref:hypothetical protein n=1 Tax=Clostridium sp. TaxID=1506 RepID=UPI003F3D7743